MPITAGEEPEREDGMSDRQRGYILELLERKNISALMASRIIAELMVVPDLNGSGLENMKQRMDLPNT